MQSHSSDQSPTITVSTLQLLFLSALSPLSLHIIIPALPAIQQTFSVSAAKVQSLVALSSVGIAIAVIIYGPLADRFGRKPVLVAAGSLFVVGSALGALAPVIGAVIGGRVLQAIGGAGGLVLARAICRDIYREDKARQYIAILMLSTAATPLVAPFIGGLVTDGFGWRWLFVVSGVFGVVLVVSVVTRLPETLLEPLPLPGLTGIFTPFAALLGMPLFRRYVLALAFASAFFFAFMSAAPFLYVQTLGGSAAGYGAWAAMVLGFFIAGSLLVARSGARLNSDSMIVIGSIIYISGALLAVWRLGGESWDATDLFGTASIMALGAGLVISSAMAGAVSLDPKRAGSASGFSTFAQFSFGAVAVTTLGYFPAAKPDALIVITLVCAGGSFVAAASLFLGRHKRPRSVQ